MIFVDTGFFFALFSLRDRHHQRAKEAFRRFEGQNLADVLVTTDQVVLETITLARMRASHKLALFMGERLFGQVLQRFRLPELRGHGEAWHPGGTCDRRGLHPPLRGDPRASASRKQVAASPPAQRERPTRPHSLTPADRTSKTMSAQPPGRSPDPSRVKLGAR